MSNICAKKRIYLPCDISRHTVIESPTLAKVKQEMEESIVSLLREWEDVILMLIWLFAWVYTNTLYLPLLFIFYFYSGTKMS